MDEIFGQENHVATLTVINNMRRNDKANVATCEYLVIYMKRDFLSYGLPLTEEQLKGISIQILKVKSMHCET